MEAVAQDHITLADALTSQVMDPLKSLEQKQEAANRKVFMSFLPPRTSLISM
jgi:hypothetical protein